MPGGSAGPTRGDLAPVGAAPPFISWPPTETMPPLAAGVVHVWGWSLCPEPAQTIDSCLAEASKILCPAELARALKLTSTPHRKRFLTAHIGMRQILGRYLLCEPATVMFETGFYGKPCLSGADRGWSNLRFNLSHSRDLALLAVSEGNEVGIDVEFIRPISENISQRFFTAAETAAMAATPEGQRMAQFYALWTCKEAFLKGIGSGITGGLDKFSVSLPSQGPPTLSDSGPPLTAGWSLAHLEPAIGYAGALAARSETLVVECFREVV